MSHVPAISVVLIFFNEERFLSEAVASVIAQTHSDWELLLVDDGSTDGSTALARAYERDHPGRIRYLDHPRHDNLGMSATRNRGISEARGAYLSFLDADDVWLPRKLEQQLAAIAANPRAAMVVGRTEWWYSWTGVAADADRDLVQQLPVPLNTVVEPPVLLRAFLQDEFASLADLLVRRDVIQAVGAYDRAFRGLYEDQVFHAKVCASYPVYVADQTWYRYRQHAQSCCAIAGAAGEKPAARGAYLGWLERFLVAESVTDAELLRVLKREMFPFRHPRLARIRRVWRTLARAARDMARRPAPWPSRVGRRIADDSSRTRPGPPR
jgi:glycosyltransferase involved in cell wall biosynthesis